MANRGLLDPLLVVPFQAALASVSVWLGTLILDRCGYELLIQGQVGIAAAVLPLPLVVGSIIGEWRRRRRVVAAVRAGLEAALGPWTARERERPRLAGLAHYLAVWRAFAEDERIGDIDESLRAIGEAQQLDYYATRDVHYKDLERLRDAIDGKAVG